MYITWHSIFSIMSCIIFVEVQNPGKGFLVYLTWSGPFLCQEPFSTYHFSCFLNLPRVGPVFPKLSHTSWSGQQSLSLWNLHPLCFSLHIFYSPTPRIHHLPTTAFFVILSPWSSPLYASVLNCCHMGLFFLDTNGPIEIWELSLLRDHLSPTQNKKMILVYKVTNSFKFSQACHSRILSVLWHRMGAARAKAVAAEIEQSWCIGYVCPVLSELTKKQAFEMGFDSVTSDSSMFVSMDSKTPILDQAERRGNKETDQEVKALCTYRQVMGRLFAAQLTIINFLI